MTSSSSSTLLGPLCALGSSLAWAIGSSVYARQAGRVGALEVNLTRAALATPLFLCATLLTVGSQGFSALSPHHLGWLSLSVICSYGLGDSLFYTAALRIGTPTALAIGSVYPAWATLFGALTLGEPVGGQRLLGTLLCIAGVIWLVLLQAAERGDRASPTTTNQRFAGVLMALLTSLFWAGNTYSVRRGGIGVEPFVINGYRYFLAALSLGAIWLWRYRRQGEKALEGERLLLSPRELGRFAPAVVLEAFIGSSIFVFAMTHTDLSIAAPLAALSPLFSVPIGVVLGTETLNLRRVCAILLTVAGVVCLVTA